MRYLIRTFDLDDARWLVIVLLAVGLYFSWSHGRELERRVEVMELASAKEPEPLELREEECGPTETEWGKGSLCVDAPIKTTCEYNGPPISTDRLLGRAGSGGQVEELTIGNITLTPLITPAVTTITPCVITETCEVKPWHRSP